MKVNFNFETRQSMQVAIAIAEEIENNTAYGREFCARCEHEKRPVLLSVKGNTFRFEGGTVVKVNLIELSQFDESWRNDPEAWVVTHASVRFYERDSSCFSVSDQKVEQMWDHKKLSALKEARPWWHPHVRDINSIKGVVCVFWNNAAADGFIRTDPDYDQDGYYTSLDEVEYSRFVEGDLERAKAEAKAKLAKRRLATR